MTKSLADLQAKFNQVERTMNELTDHKTRSAIENVRTYLLSFVKPLSSYITTYTPKSHKKALKIAAMSNKTLWFAEENGKDVFYEVEAINLYNKVENIVQLEDVAKSYHTIDSFCIDNVYNFLETVDAQMLMEIADNQPTSEKQIKKRKEQKELLEQMAQKMEAIATKCRKAAAS